MGTINLDYVDAIASPIYSIIIVRKEKSPDQVRRETDLDNTFDGDEASDVVYHRSNGTTVNFRAWQREEFFEADPGSEITLGDNSLLLRTPTHKLWFTVSDGDWLEFQGLYYDVVMAKRAMGGTSLLLLHLR